MWGNRLGWGISAAIAALFFFMIYLLLAAGQPSPPTKYINEKVLSPLSVPVNPTAIVPSMTDTTDSGELYWDAINEYRRNPTPYNNLVSARDFRESDAKLPAIQAILKATNSNQATIFGRKLEEVINYDNQKEALDDLVKVADGVKRLGLLRKPDNPKDAQKYVEALFSLGYKMYQERVIFQELQKGDALMGDALQMLASIADTQKDTARVAAMKAATGARIDYYKQTLEPTWRVISSIDPKVVATHPGDVMKLATDAQERLWRVEAVLKLGRQRFYSERKGDQLAAMRKIRQMAEDEPDPAVKMAAAAARDLTIEKYRMLQ